MNILLTRIGHKCIYVASRLEVRGKECYLAFSGSDHAHSFGLGYVMSAPKSGQELNSYLIFKFSYRVRYLKKSIAKRDQDFISFFLHL